MKTHPIVSSFLFFAATALAAEQPSVTTHWRYQSSQDFQLRHGKASVELPTVRFDRRTSTDPRMEKTLFLIEMGNALKVSLKNYNEACGPNQQREEEISRRPIIRPMPRPMPHPLVPSAECQQKRRTIGNQLFQTVSDFSLAAGRTGVLREDGKIAEVLDLSRKLAKNMTEAKEIARPYGTESLKMTSMPGAGGLNITSGGAQDFGYFRKIVTDGYVPQSDSVNMEGFLKEFDLFLSMPPCDQLICVRPAVTVDPKAGKLFVQIGMNSNVTKANFKRKPLNLSVVLDISGSMSASDNTEKSRLEWAKDALVQTIQELNEQDVLSIVLFDTNSEILVRPEPVTNKSRLIEMVKALKTKGSTNLEAGLRDGYQLTSSQIAQLPGYEHRLILISDAGLNTGATSEEALLKLVTDYANEGIGLTALGLGLNFNQPFIHGITYSKGGNYMFVHSGKDMLKYFQNFDFLVTPVAYQFKANLVLNDIDAKFVKAYGIPMKEGEPLKELINIQTLFFSEEGGAIVLEYDINK